jgi:hypothetical protein
MEMVIRYFGIVKHVDMVVRWFGGVKHVGMYCLLRQHLSVLGVNNS